MAQTSTRRPGLDHPPETSQWSRSWRGQRSRPCHHYWLEWCNRSRCQQGWCRRHSWEFSEARRPTIREENHKKPLAKRTQMKRASTFFWTMKFQSAPVEACFCCSTESVQTESEKTTPKNGLNFGTGFRLRTKGRTSCKRTLSMWKKQCVSHPFRMRCL